MQEVSFFFFLPWKASQGKYSGFIGEVFNFFF